MKAKYNCKFGGASFSVTLELDDEEKAIIINPDRCDLCGLCELRCPDIAIELK